MSASRWRESARLVFSREHAWRTMQRALAVVADEGDEAALVLLAGRRLARVVQDGREAQRLAAGELVGERLGEQRADVGGDIAREPLEIALDLEQVGEHLERVPVDVEVVVGVLLDPAQALELREHPGRAAELVEQPQAPERVGTGDEQA